MSAASRINRIRRISKNSLHQSNFYRIIYYMNSLKITLAAVAFLLLSPSPAQDGQANSHFEGNFVGTSVLDTSQAVSAPIPELYCYDVDPEAWSCYSPKDIPSLSEATFDSTHPIWVGSKADLHKIFPDKIPTV